MTNDLHDWQEWHQAYDQADSPLARRLATVQRCIAHAFDAAPPGPIRIVSVCAGEGRDVLGVLEHHPRRADVQGRLVELDPGLAAIARAHAPESVEVVCANDMFRTIDALPILCAPHATVVWTRHRRRPDATPAVRGRFARSGFEEVAFHAPEGTRFGVGMHRLTAAPRPFTTDMRLFDFVGYRVLDPDVCRECGFSYAVGRAEIIPWLRSDASSFVAKLATFDDTAVRTRREPDVWSPLEYACHVRDMLGVQTERVVLVQREIDPEFVPMGRDERVVEDRYNEQDPIVVAEQVRAAAEKFAALLDSLDDNAWLRTGIYNYPARALRTAEWIAIHTNHELLHHRGDLR